MALQYIIKYSLENTSNTFEGKATYSLNVCHPITTLLNVEDAQKCVELKKLLSISIQSVR